MAKAGDHGEPEPGSLRVRLRGRRIQERLLHLSYYLEEDPAESLRIGLELSEAAHKTRRGDG